MPVAFAVGEGEKARAGGVEGCKEVSGGLGEVNYAHRLSSLRSLSREEKRIAIRGSHPCTRLAPFCILKPEVVKGLCSEFVAIRGFGVCRRLRGEVASRREPDQD